MAVYTLFFIAISLLVYNSLADSTPQCSKLQVTPAECQKAGQKIIYSGDTAATSEREPNITVSSGRCLVQVISRYWFAATPKADIDNAITEMMTVCPQGGSISKKGFNITVDEVKTDDRIYGPNASPDGNVVCTNDAPVRMEDCFQAVKAIPVNKNFSSILASSRDNGIISSAGTCTVKVSARSGINIIMEPRLLLNAVSKPADKNLGSSLIEACTIQNTKTARPAYMVQLGSVFRPNQRVLVQTLNNGKVPGGSKP